MRDDYDYLTQLPYRLEITALPDGTGFRAEFPLLPGCSAIGKTISEAIEHGIDAKAQWLAHNGTGNTPDNAEPIIGDAAFRAGDEYSIIDETLSDRKPLKVAAYIREVVPNNGMRSPIELQSFMYEKTIKGHSGWQFSGLYVDKGSAKRIEQRPGLTQLLADCSAGKIDVVICKSCSRMARSFEIMSRILRTMLQCNPPVGIYFESEDVFTLAEDTDTSLQFWR